jgi:hypothetical protein
MGTHLVVESNYGTARCVAGEGNVATDNTGSSSPKDRAVGTDYLLEGNLMINDLRIQHIK